MNLTEVLCYATCLYNRKLRAWPQLPETVRSPGFTELKLYFELEWGTNGKLDHKREHYSGCLFKTRYCVLHNLTFPGYLQGLPVEHTPVIQPQGYKWHHLLKSVKLVLWQQKKQRVCSANNITVKQVSQTTISGHIHAYSYIHRAIRTVIGQKGQWCWKRNFYLAHFSYNFFVTI